MSTETKTKLSLDRNDLDSLQAFANENIHNQSRGFPTLVANVNKYLKYCGTLDEVWGKIEKSVNWMNREPKSNDEDTYSFYDNLSTHGQRAMCEEFGLDYDSYDSVEDVVEALVAEHKRRMSEE